MTAFGLALLFTGIVAVVGSGPAQLARLRAGPALALAPALGLALLAVLTAWTTRLNLPPALSGVLVLALAATGAATHRYTWRTHTTRAPILVALAASLAPLILLAAALGQVPVPLSSHDGAYHVETIHLLRAGVPQTTWYPLGLHTTMAALLAVIPFVDTAAGATAFSFGLSALAVLGAGGLAAAVWRSRWIAAFAAVLTALTFHFPYSAHIWSGWPLLSGIILTFGLWAVALWYIRQPTWRLALLGALLAAAIVLTHGTEVYTALIGLAIIAIGYARHIRWLPAIAHLALAVVAALAFTAPYLPTLLGWAAGGGVAASGATELDRIANAATALGSHTGLIGELGAWLHAGIIGAGPVDMLLRAVLLALGIRAIFGQRQGRLTLALSLVFAAISLAFEYLDLPAVRRLQELTFPWGLDYRLIMVPSVLWSLVAAAGLAHLLQLANAARHRWPHRLGHANSLAWRRLLIAAAALAFLSVEMASVVIYRTLEHWRSQMATYSSDDAQAMAWLRDHAPPGSLLVNDGSADAGIWAPYTANLAIVAPRSAAGGRPQETERLLNNLTKLETLPELCDGRVRYLFRGAVGTVYENRHFPPLDQLRASPSLQEVFTSGQAALFRVTPPCAPP